MTVRPAVPALAIQERIDYLGAALSADALALDCKLIRPAQFGAEPLPALGVVALRTAIAEGARLRDWVRGGGVLWSSLDLLRDDPALRELVADIGGEDGKAQVGGEYRTGQADVDDILKVARRETAPVVTLPASAEIVLRAGTAPLVAVLPAGRGWVVVELVPLATTTDRDFQNRGTVPLWVGRIARDYTARLHAPRFWTAGQNAPAAHTLKRGASVDPVRRRRPGAARPGRVEGRGRRRGGGAAQPGGGPPAEVGADRQRGQLHRRPAAPARRGLGHLPGGRGPGDRVRRRSAGGVGGKSVWALTTGAAMRRTAVRSAPRSQRRGRCPNATRPDGSAAAIPRPPNAEHRPPDLAPCFATSAPPRVPSRRPP